MSSSADRSVVSCNLPFPTSVVYLGGIKGSASEPNERSMDSAVGKKKGKKTGPRKVKITSTFLLPCACHVCSFLGGRLLLESSDNGVDS